MAESRYLLDTNVLSSLLRDPGGSVAQRIAQQGEATICTSIVVACELRYGVAKKGSAKLAERVEGLLESLEVLPLDKEADRRYGEIRFHLEKQGRPIGPNDLLIAAHALALDLTLVTHNVEEFARVPDLRLEDWLAP
jgi:tRNA(fMet)-specific endonuclease VapC